MPMTPNYLSVLTSPLLSLPFIYCLLPSPTFSYWWKIANFSLTLRNLIFFLTDTPQLKRNCITNIGSSWWFCHTSKFFCTWSWSDFWLNLVLKSYYHYLQIGTLPHSWSSSIETPTFETCIKITWLCIMPSRLLQLPFSGITKADILKF